MAEEKCFFIEEEKGDMLSGGSGNQTICGLANSRIVCDGIKDKERCPICIKKPRGEK